jgi:hypothetical protein
MHKFKQKFNLLREQEGYTLLSQPATCPYPKPKETQTILRHWSFTAQCRLIYSDTSANEDNSFRDHIR